MDKRRIARKYYPQNIVELKVKLEKVTQEETFKDTGVPFPADWLGIRSLDDEDIDFLVGRLDWDTNLLRQSHYQGILTTYQQILKYARNTPEADLTKIQDALDDWEQKGISKVRLFFLCAVVQ